MVRVLFSLLLISYSVLGFAQSEIRFMDGSINAIIDIAKQRDKHLFIDTYADWCKPCKRMELVFKDKEVADFFNDNFVNYRVNMQIPERANGIRKLFDVVFLPTMLIVAPDGRVKFQIDNEMTSAELLFAAKKALYEDKVSASPLDAMPKEVVSLPVVPADQKDMETPAEIVEVKVKNLPEIDPSKATNSQSEVVNQVPGEKILHVLGAGEVPPEFLMQEAYFRLELMDGSHKAKAKEYLATQKDWNTTVNRKFILDFVNSYRSEEFRFMIDHIDEFRQEFGDDKVNNVLEVLVYRALYNAVPRPSIEESIELFGYIDTKNAVTKANDYYFQRLIAESNYEEILQYTEIYFKKYSEDHQMKFKVAKFLSDNGGSDDLFIAKKMMEEALKLKPDKYVYLVQLAEVYEKMDNPKKAKKLYQKAIEIAVKEGKNADHLKLRLQEL